MCDSGCNSLLLPLKNGELSELLKLFPRKTHTYRISVGSGVALQALVLRIESSTGKIEVKLNGSSVIVYVSTLRFHLSESVIQELVSRAKEFGLPDKNVQTIQEVIKLNGALDKFFEDRENKNRKPSSPGKPLTTRNKTERKHALLGQSLLGSVYCTMQVNGIFLAVNEKYNFDLLPETVQLIKETAGQMRVTFPEFDDLEDEDHDGDDEYESYSPQSSFVFLDS